MPHVLQASPKMAWRTLKFVIKDLDKSLPRDPRRIPKGSDNSNSHIETKLRIQILWDRETRRRSPSRWRTTRWRKNFFCFLCLFVFDG